MADANSYEMSSFDRTRHKIIQGFFLVEEVARVYPETYMGPWGWQWRDGGRDLVSVLPAEMPITIEALMDNIEKVRTFRRSSPPSLLMKIRMRQGCIELSQTSTIRDPPSAPLSLTKYP